MCGIVGYVGTEQAAPILLAGLSKLEYRGYDSAGIAIRNEDTGDITVVKAKGRLKILSEKTNEGHAVPGTCGIGHTRWATHGEPSENNAHPHCTDDKSVVLVHNGIIENYQELKDKLIKSGYAFYSQTDTEIAVKLVDYYYRKTGTPLEAISRAMLRIRGSYAFGIMFHDHPGKIFAARKDSPLIIGKSQTGCLIASDVPAILDKTRNVYYIGNHEIAELSQDEIHFYNIDREEIQKEQVEIKWDAESAEKGGYEHFMLKEIHEQPNAIKTTIAPRITDGLPNLEECGITPEILKGFNQIYVVACGTAMHAGMVGKYVIEKLAKVPVIVDIASEFRYRDPLITDKDLVIIISQSGETADSLAAMRLAKELGAKTLAVVNAKGSSIAREADMLIYTHAGPEIAVASTKAYMVQIAVMYLLAFELALAVGEIDESECRRLTELLQKTPELIEQILENKEETQYIASSLITADSLLYIGRGLDYALSMEGSLKLKEISYIHSESYAAGELKHGTISLISDGMPVIAVATQQKLFEKTVSNIKEVKARGAKVVMICRDSYTPDSDIADFKFGLPEIEDILMPMIAVVPLQLIAYYTSVLKGNDVDKPRNLAKSVTVE